MGSKCSECGHDMEMHDNKLGCKEEGSSSMCPCLYATEYTFIDDNHGVALWECKQCKIRVFDFDTMKHSNFHTKVGSDDK